MPASMPSVSICHGKSFQVCIYVYVSLNRCRIPLDPCHSFRANTEIYAKDKTTDHTHPVCAEREASSVYVTLKNKSFACTEGIIRFRQWVSISTLGPSTPLGRRRPGIHKLRRLLLMHCALRIEIPIVHLVLPLAHRIRLRPRPRLDRCKLGVVLLRNCHALPGLFFTLRKALGARGSDGFGMETLSTVTVIPRIGLRRVRLGTNDRPVLAERKDVWAGRPHGVEERVEVEVAGRRCRRWHRRVLCAVSRSISGHFRTTLWGRRTVG